MFTDPTAAEAILAAMQRDLAALARAAPHRPPQPNARRDDVEILYVHSLAALGDRRIAGRLARRYASARSATVRQALAVACGHLGRPDILNHHRSRQSTTQPTK
jgi:hypothetical protein